MTMNRSQDLPKRGWVFGSLLLIGFCSSAFLATSLLHADEEEAPSILLPAVDEEKSEGEMTEDFSSSVRREENVPPRRPLTVPPFAASEENPQRLVNPRQLIHERAAREARAREARLESRRWHGISSSRPSSAWNSHYSYAPIGYYGWGGPFFPGYLYYGSPLYSPTVSYPIRGGL